ncbi:alpha/beta hydrolase [Aldersonia kunmingensis]|uniref:alpha/beta hydrolase n=1 Tax=Aldersonia kunmingensis TaxID=408066 RepID=UPI00082F4404|nr:alpha/beta hydrolase [Aldersonia kunmingensis]
MGIGIAVCGTASAEPSANNLYTGQPSVPHEIAAAGAGVLKAILAPVGGVLAVVPYKIPVLTDGVAYPFVTQGLDVSKSDFAGMPVLTFTPPKPSGKVVVAIHGGAYVGEATVFHWMTYTDIARQTDATVIVPDYTLSPVGTAETEVPRMTDFLARTVAEHGAENVSVVGDSAGGGLALLATQDLVRRNAAVPGRLVLLAPWLDVSVSDQRAAAIDDPLLDVGNGAKDGKLWAGRLDTRDALVSPLYGSLDGLPPTAVYSTSRDLLTVDTLRLRDRVLAEGRSNFTFRLRNGLMHDHAIYAPLPDAQADRANLYHDLDVG